MSDSDTSTSAYRVCHYCGRVYPSTKDFFNSNGRNGLSTRCRTCQREYAKQYYAANREMVKAKVKAHNQAHPEVRRAWAEKRLAEHGDAIRAEQRTRYAANPHKWKQWVEKHREHRAAYMKHWAKLHRKERRAYHRKLRADHPDRYAAYARNHIAVVMGNGGHHTCQDVAEQYERQRGRCFYCGKKVGNKYHVDHVVPLKLGGGSNPENLVIACPSCNCSKRAKHPMDFNGTLF